MVYAVCGVSAFLRSLCRGVSALPFAGCMAVYRRTPECYGVLIKFVINKGNVVLILLFLSFCQLKQVVWCLCAVGMLLRAGWSFIVLGQVFHCCRVSRAMLVALVVGAGWACFRFILTLVGRCAHIQKSPQVHFSDHCGLCVGGLPAVGARPCGPCRRHFMPVSLCVCSDSRHCGWLSM